MADLPARDHVVDGTLEAWRRHGAERRGPEAVRAEFAAGTLPRGVRRQRGAAAATRPRSRSTAWPSAHAELDARAARVAGFAARARCRARRPGAAVRGRARRRAGRRLPRDRCAPARPSSRRPGADRRRARAPARATASRSPRSWPRPTSRERLEQAVADAAPVGTVVAIGARGARPARARRRAGGGAGSARAAARDAARCSPTPRGPPGAPKGVPLSHANVLASIRAVMLAWRWSADDVLVHALPLSHQHGLGGVHAHACSRARGRCIFSRFDRRRAVRRDPPDQRATVLFAVPAMYERLDGWTASARRSALAAARRLRVGAALAAARRAGRRAASASCRSSATGAPRPGSSVSNPYDGPRRPGRVGRFRDRARPGDPSGASADGRRRDPRPRAAGLRRLLAAARTRPREALTRRRLVPHRRPRPPSIPTTAASRSPGRSKELIISGGLNVYPARGRGGARGAPRRGGASRSRACRPSAGARRSSAFVVPDGEASTPTR